MVENQAAFSIFACIKPSTFTRVVYFYEDVTSIFFLPEFFRKNRKVELIIFAGFKRPDFDFFLL